MLYLLPEPARLGDNFWQQALPALSKTRQNSLLRFRFNRDRVLNAVAYLLMRLGLKQEYGFASAPELRIEPHGKPVLHAGYPHFSFSHCHQAVACAVDRQPIGVDVEAWAAFAPEHVDDQLAARIFSNEERRTIAAAADKRQAACALWTSKESLGKYSGKGLGEPLTHMLPRPDVRIDATSLPEHEITVAVCRAALPGLEPPRLNIISHNALRRFVQACLQQPLV